MTPAAQKPLKIFCSYSRKDEEHLNDLRGWLRGLERRGLIQWWHDREIVPGWEWEETIDKNLRTADIILLLVSPDFMASDYVYENEISRAVERHERGEARVIPIIVRPSDWEDAPFYKIQAVPKDARPITRWPDRDEAWLDVLRGVRKAIEELLVERQEQAAKVRYRKAVKEVWVDNKISGAEAERLDTLISELGLAMDAAADIEREVMGESKEAMLERQAQAAREEERNERLDELYAEARRLHQNQEWQAVINVFEQIHAEDTDYPDPAGILGSAHEALESARREDMLRRYREAVERAWTDEKVNKDQIERLRDLAKSLNLTARSADTIEREVMGDTIKVIFERRERSAKEQYLRAVEEAWTDNKLSKVMAEQLDTLAGDLGLNTKTAAAIEREIIGDTKERILEHQEQTAKEKVQEERKRRVANLYEEGQRHMDAEEWQQALECFEEVRRLDTGYRETTKLWWQASRKVAAQQAVQRGIAVSSVAKMKADELGVDLSQVKGSGINGWITAEDVWKYAKGRHR